MQFQHYIEKWEGDFHPGVEETEDQVPGVDVKLLLVAGTPIFPKGLFSLSLSQSLPFLFKLAFGINRMTVKIICDFVNITARLINSTGTQTD